MEVLKMSKTIYNADYSEYLPEALKKDPKMVALANATAATLLDTSGIIDNVLIYSRFDELPEELVDILAYDLHVDWYDYNYPLEAKRDLVKTVSRFIRKWAQNTPLKQRWEVYFQKVKWKSGSSMRENPDTFILCLM